MRRRKHSTRARRAIATALALTTLAAPAAARDPAAAEALFRFGRDALRRGDFESACAAFEGSQRLDPAGGTALNLAQCEEGRGHVASAWQHLREALDLLPADDDRVPFTKKRLTELVPRVPHLTIRLAATVPAGTRVTRDDVEVTGALLGFAQPVDPGRHVIRVSAPQHAERSYEVAAAEGRAGELVVAPGSLITTPPARMSGRRKAGLIVGGFGLAAAGVGIAEGFAVKSRGDQRSRLCPDNVCPDAAHLAIARDLDSSGKTLSVLSTVTLGVGAAALAVGTYLIVSGGSKERAPTVAITPSPAGAGLGLGGTF